MIEIKAPNLESVPDVFYKIFLAGSIEMGKADDWQTRVINELSTLKVDILNPRRTDWDSSWEQKITNPQFLEQVTWELNALTAADIIIMYLQPGTISPISLLELGLHARGGKLLVCCPEGFHRKGNVDIVCERYSIPVYESLDELLDQVKRSLQWKYHD